MFIFTFTIRYDESKDTKDAYSGYVKNLYIYQRVRRKFMTDTINRQLKEQLSTKEKFLPLLDYFIKKAIDEQNKTSKTDKSSIMFSEFYEKYMDFYPRTNVDNIFKYCRSPIEKIFVNSLVLLFLKNGIMGLHITQPLKDAETEIANYRTAHKNIMHLAEQYKKNSGDNEMKNFESFFQKKIDSGKFTIDDYNEFEYHRIIVDNFIWNSLHLTIQAGFPNFELNKKGAKVDMLIWSPSDEKFKLIVECDGFQFHNSKDNFERDRKRDRIFKAQGYQVIRFSGSEITKDPVAVSSELYDFIETMDRKTSA